MTESTKNLLHKYKPAVIAKTLLLIAGLIWACTGIMLVSKAANWLSVSENINIYIYISIGVLSAMIIHHFGFIKIVNKNIERILPLKGKRCIFSFVPWRSYLMVTIMITLGAFLRHSAIPKKFLSILYIAIGLALFLSSMQYFRIYLTAK